MTGETQTKLREEEAEERRQKEEDKKAKMERSSELSRQKELDADEEFEKHAGAAEQLEQYDHTKAGHDILLAAVLAVCSTLWSRVAA